MENVTDLYAHAQTVDTRRSSPIYQALGYEATLPSVSSSLRMVARVQRLVLTQSDVLALRLLLSSVDVHA